MDLYSAVARRLNEEGIVDVEYSVDGNGHARDVKEVYASSPHLGSQIPEYLKSAKFGVPANWEQTGSQNARYTLEFRFALGPPQGCSATSGAAPRNPEARVISVCGSRLPGAPTH
jgi:Gram-negative bacterial TonB protein C-terminal